MREWSGQVGGIAMFRRRVIGGHRTGRPRESKLFEQCESRPLTLMVRGTCSSLRRFLSEASRIQEEIMKKKIGTFALGAAMAFGIVAGAWAQSSGAGGTGGGAVGGGVGGNTMGGSTGGRVTAPTPNANPSTPNTVPQSPQNPVSPGTQTSPGNGTH